MQYSILVAISAFVLDVLIDLEKKQDIRSVPFVEIELRILSKYSNESVITKTPIYLEHMLIIILFF